MTHANAVRFVPFPNPTGGALSDSAPSSQVSVLLVRALVDVVKQRGISAEALLGPHTAGLCAEPAERSLPRAVFSSLFARAIQLTSDPALGLHCGLHASNASFGLMTPLIAHAPTLRRALQLIIQFQPLLIESLRLSITERIGVAELRCEMENGGAVDRSFTEFVIAGLVRCVQQFGCARDEVRAVCFEHARPAYYHAYAAAFSGAERFAQPYSGIEFSAYALDRPHLHRHAELHTLVLAQAERNLQRRWRPPSCAERVMAWMNNRAATETPDMSSAARELGLSVRSLRRHLEEEGTSFRALTQRKLHERACAMLRDPTCTLQGIAHELGFSDATAFHRAFRRWTKLTPAEYRSAFVVPSDVAAPAEPPAQL